MILKSLMRGAVTTALLVGAALAAPGCGGSDDKSPEEYCEESVEILCRKFFNCFTKEELDAAAVLIGNSQADCRTKLGAQSCNKDMTRCDAGKTFDAKRAQECVDGFDDFSCDDLNGFFTGATPEPAACELTCKQD